MKPQTLNVVLILSAILLGFFVAPPQSSNSLLLPLLAILIFFSARRIHLELPTKHEFAITVELFAVSYFVLSAIYVLLGLAIFEPEVQTGIWLLALMPPAINIIPLSQMLKGNVKESMLAGILSILVAMLLIPIGGYFFFGADVSITGIAKTLALGVLIPAGIGIAMRRISALDKPSQWVLPIANSIIFYILIGTNSALLIANMDNRFFWMIVGVLVLAKFGFVSWINMQFARLQSKQERVDVVLFASFKNIALAAAIAATAFPLMMPGILIPIAIESVLFALQLIFIEYLLHKTVQRLR